jgi:hypothetical protein
MRTLERKDPNNQPDLNIIKLELKEKALSKTSDHDICIVEILREPQPPPVDMMSIELLPYNSSNKDMHQCTYCGSRAVFLRTLNKNYCFSCKKYSH